MKVPGIPFIPVKWVYRDKDGTKFGVAIHCTANTAPARNEISYAQNRTDGTSSHFYADKVEVLQGIDTKDRAGHAGSEEGNEHGISVEITGLVSWSREKWLANVAWDALGRVLATLCSYYSIPVMRVKTSEMKRNPKIRGFYSHDDMRIAWGGTDHIDPGPNFPWDKLFTSVIEHLNPPNPPAKEASVTVERIIIAREKDKPEVYVGDFITRRHIKDPKELAGVQWWVNKRGGDSTVHIFEPGTIGVLGILV